MRVPVSAPHGPIRLRNGELLYLGKSYGNWQDMRQGAILACRSSAGGRAWSPLGTVPLLPARSATTTMNRTWSSCPPDDCSV